MKQQHQTAGIAVVYDDDDGDDGDDGDEDDEEDDGTVNALNAVANYKKNQQIMWRRLV